MALLPVAALDVGNVSGLIVFPVKSVFESDEIWPVFVLVALLAIQT